MDIARELGHLSYAKKIFKKKKKENKQTNKQTTWFIVFERHKIWT